MSTRVGLLYWISLFLLNCGETAAFCVLPGRRTHSSRVGQHSSVCKPPTIPGLQASSDNFYNDFGDFDEEDDDEDDDDEDDFEDMDDAAVADFRSRMGNLFGDPPTEADDEEDDESMSSVDDLISFATSKGGEAKPSTDWATPQKKLEIGYVLLANPAKFCADFGKKPSTPSPALLSKFGLTLPPPADLGPDRRADLLPVLVLLEHRKLGSQAVLLNRRTGYLLGDLEQPAAPSDEGMLTPAVDQVPKLGAFMIQPLWFGGTAASGVDENASSSGLDMLHMCPIVKGAKQLTEDGLMWGGDPAQAQDAMADPSLDKPMTGFDFKFFVQSTRWLPLQLEKELRDGTWFVASVSKEVLFKPRDRMGTRRAKPLWTEIMELMGEEYEEIRDQLYADE